MTPRRPAPAAHHPTPLRSPRAPRPRWLVTAPAPLIGERFPGHRYKLPRVARRVQRQREHSMRIVVVRLAVGDRRAHRIQPPPPRAHHELADALLRISRAVGVLRRKPL